MGAVAYMSSGYGMGSNIYSCIGTFDATNKDDGLMSNVLSAKRLNSSGA